MSTLRAHGWSCAVWTGFGRLGMGVFRLAYGPNNRKDAHCVEFETYTASGSLIR
jgi:hypothetical protein